MQKIILLIFIFSIVYSCKQPKPADMNQGVITYSVSYPKNIKSQKFAEFLPNKMTTTFKGEKYKHTIKGDLSLYKLEFISNSKKDSSSTLFRIFDKRMFYNHSNTNHLFFNKAENTKIEYFNSETKIIAGATCYKAIVHFNNPEAKSITVYYTEEINSSMPNKNTPFADIPGTLMEFSMLFQGMELSLVAQKIDIKKIDNKAFEIPNNYSHSKPCEIDELISTLLE